MTTIQAIEEVFAPRDELQADLADRETEWKYEVGEETRKGEEEVLLALSRN